MDVEHHRLLDHCGTCKEFRADFTDTGKDVTYGHCRVKPRSGSIHEKTYKCVDYVTHKDFLPAAPPKPEFVRPIRPEPPVVRVSPPVVDAFEDEPEFPTGGVAKTAPTPRIEHRVHDDEDNRGPIRRHVGSGGAVSTAQSSPPDGLRATIISAIAEYMGLSATPMADRWRGGTLILEPGNKDTQSKEIPIDALFHKIVMIRNQLRVLEAKINGNDELDDADKVELQQYITRCYGSLTTFNILFADKNDRFVGASGDKST